MARSWGNVTLSPSAPRASGSLVRLPRADRCISARVPPRSVGATLENHQSPITPTQYEWQAVAGLEDGILIVERTAASPNPAVEVVEQLPDGTEFKAVWSHLRQSGVAKLVTVHYFD